MFVSFKNLKPRWSWIILTLVILLVVIVRVRLREMPLERDEGEYAYAGQLMLQGTPPYREAYNMKLPGTYAAYALIMAAFGQTPSGIHLGVMLVNVASIVLVYLVGRRLLDEITGVVAAISFALLSLSPSVLGLAGHATHFVALFALAGVYVLLRATDQANLKPELRNPREVRSPKSEVRSSAASSFIPLGSLYARLFLCGILLGLAFLMKQHGIFFGIFAGLYLLWLFLERWVAAREEAKRAPLMVPAARQAIGGSPAGRPPAPKRLSHFAAGKRRESQKSEVGGQGSEVGGQGPEVGGQSSGVADAEAQGVPSLDVERSMLDVGRSPGSENVQGSAPLHPPSLDVQRSMSNVGRFRSNALLSLSLLVLGFALPYLLTCLVLWIAGVFPQFWFWTVTYAAKYVSIVSSANGEQLWRMAMAATIGPDLLFWALPVVGGITMWWDNRLNTSSRVFLTVLFLCSCASVSVGLYFRSHYFITLIPAMGLLLGFTVSRSIHLLRHAPNVEVFLAVPVLLCFVIAVGWVLIGNGAVWFSLPPQRASRAVYSSTCFHNAAEAADYIHSRSRPSARIAVLGSEPEIYFLSRRRSASGYIYVYPLMEPQPLASRMQEEMISEIERSQPEYFVYVEDNFSWLRRADSDLGLFKWWDAYRSANLRLLRTLEISEGQDESDLQGLSRGTPSGRIHGIQKYLLIFERK